MKDGISEIDALKLEAILDADVAAVIESAGELLDAVKNKPKTKLHFLLAGICYDARKAAENVKKIMEATGNGRNYR